MRATSLQHRLGVVVCLLWAFGACADDDADNTNSLSTTSSEDAATVDETTSAKSSSSQDSSSASKAGSTKPSSTKPGATKDGASASGGDGSSGTSLTTLQWKRGHALESDLVRALELPPEELCREFGTSNCVRDVHLVPLGGSNPFTTGMFEPAAEPLASTPTVVERVVLSACSQRVELDRKAKDKAKVFSQFALDEQAPAPSADATHELTSALFQRLLSRDPTDKEQQTLGALALGDDGEAISGSDFAKLACFTVGSSAEFLFY